MVLGPNLLQGFWPKLKAMLDIQVRFFLHLCHLGKSVNLGIVFKEIAERPWPHVWWSGVLEFMHRLSQMPQTVSTLLSSRTRVMMHSSGQDA